MNNAANNHELRERMRQRRERWQIQQASWFDAVGLVVPIAAPMVPAFLTATAIYHHYPSLLGLAPLFVLAIAIIAGGVVEMLGILSIETMFDMRTYNQTKSAAEESAPFGYAAGAVVFYLVLVLLLVVLLKVWPDLALWSLVPLNVLGFITSWVMVLRKQHAERIHTHEMANAEQSESVQLNTQIEQLNAQLNSARSEQQRQIERSTKLQTELDEWKERSAKQREEIATLAATLKATQPAPDIQPKRSPLIDKDAKKQALLSFYTEHPGAPIRDAAEHIGCSTGSASTYANELVEQQRLNKDADGKYQPRILVQLPTVQTVQLNGHNGHH